VPPLVWVAAVALSLSVAAADITDLQLDVP